MFILYLYIKSLSKESDMDIVIVADNVALTVGKTGLEKYLTFQTFIDRWSATTRFIIGTYKEGASEQKTAGADYNYQAEDEIHASKSYNNVRFYDILGDCFATFWNEWEDKTTLPIQFALQENAWRSPGYQFVIASGGDGEVYK